MIVEDLMLEHYNYIINVKSKELTELYEAVAYREQELEQLRTTLDKMKVILDGSSKDAHI